MAYDTRAQDGTSSRPYRGAQTEPLQASQENREDSHSYNYYEQPSYAPLNNKQHQQYYDMRKPSVGNTQERSFHHPHNGRSGPQLQDQGQYDDLAVKSKVSSSRPLADRNSAVQGEYYEYGGRQPEHHDPFARPHVAHQYSSQSMTEDRSTPGGHLRYVRRAMPPPRSYSHDNVPNPGQYQSLPNSRLNSPDYAPTNENNLFGYPQFSTETHAGRNVRSPKSRSLQPKKSSVKERIVVEPSSPETLGWDNPFPTFPTNKKKTPHLDADSTKGNVASMSAKGVPSQAVSQHQRPQTANSKRSNESARSHEKQLYGGELQREAVLQSRLPNSIERGQQKYTIQSTMIDGDSGVDPVRYRQQDVQQENGLFQGQQIQQNGQPIPVDRIFEDLRLAQISLGNPALIVDQQRSRTLPAEVPETMVHSRFLAQGRPETQPSPSNVVRNYALPHRPVTASNPRYVSYEGSQPGATQQNRNPTPPENPYQSRENLLEQHGSYSQLCGSYPKPSYESTKPYKSGAYAELHSPLEDMPNLGAVPLRGAIQGNDTTTNQELHIQSRPNRHDTARLPPGSRHGQPGVRTGPSEPAMEAHRSRSQPNLRDQRELASNYDQGFDFANGGQMPPLPQLPAHADCGWNSERSMDGRYYPPSTSRNGQIPLASSQQPIGRLASQYELPTFTNQGHDEAYNYVAPDPQGTRSPAAIGLYVNHGRRPSTGANPYDRARPTPSPMNGQQVRVDQSKSPEASAGLNSSKGPTLPPLPRPFNPDVLPEHPAPVRPGLMQLDSNPVAKPSPVRQYDSTPSPVPPKSFVQPSLTASSKGRERLTLVTCDELDRLKQIVRAKPDDHGTQLVLAKKMVEAASVLVDEGGRADHKQRNKNREKYILDAHKLVKKLVNGGYTEAMFYLADCHGRGQLGLEVDPKEAFNLYQSAAKAGHPQSAYRVAVCCEMGQEDGGGTRRDPLKAIQWYKRAATLGDTPAMYKMGMIQLKGLLGQPKNPREAIVWLKRAADRADVENPHALHELGLLFETASGNDNIVKDEAYSRQLFTDAADFGYKFSQFRLGSAYEYGHLGCPIDPRQSIAWYSKAAVQEEHQSELALSGWYLTGSEGVLQQSDTEAYLWARKAAQAGLAKAEYAMAYFTEVGIGAPAKIEDAKRWYWRAAAQNYPKARERLEDLRKGGARMQKSRVSRSAVKKGSDGECLVM